MTVFYVLQVLDDNKVRKWCQHLQARMVNVDKKVIDQEGARLDLLVPTPKYSRSGVFLVTGCTRQLSWLQEC